MSTGKDVYILYIRPWYRYVNKFLKIKSYSFVLIPYMAWRKVWR